MPTVTLRYATTAFDHADLENVLCYDGGMTRDAASNAVDAVLAERFVQLRFCGRETCRRFVVEINRLGIVYTIAGRLKPGRVHETCGIGKRFREYRNSIPDGEIQVTLYGGPFDRTAHYVPEDWVEVMLPRYGYDYIYVRGVRQEGLSVRERRFHYVARQECELDPDA